MGLIQDRLKLKLVFLLLPEFKKKKTKIFSSSTVGTTEQCDQMARMFFQYLATCNNENLPKIILIVPKLVHNVAKYQIKP